MAVDGTVAGLHNESRCSNLTDPVYFIHEPVSEARDKKGNQHNNFSVFGHVPAYSAHELLVTAAEPETLRRAHMKSSAGPETSTNG